MRRLITIGEHTRPIQPLTLTPEKARQLGALLIARADEYDRHHEGETP